MGDLKELLARVKAATAPDRELDDAILKALNIHSWAGRMSYPDLPMWVDFGASNISASIDAALAMTERMLGDQWYSIMLDAIRELGASGTEPPSALPRYILAALLTALSDTKEGKP